MRSIPRLKDCIFWNHVNVYSNFFHLKTYCLKKSCKVAAQKRSSTYLHLHLSLGICNIVVLQSDKPSLRTIPTVCKQLCDKKRLPFFVSFFGAFYVDCLKDGLIRDLTIFHGLKSNEKDRLRGICVGLRNTRNFTAAVLFGNETSF